MISEGSCDKDCSNDAKNSGLITIQIYIKTENGYLKFHNITVFLFN